MPTDKVKNILKGFGEGANVVLQESLARGSRPAGDYDIGDGEAVDVIVDGSSGSASNPTGRALIGAIIINKPEDDSNGTVRVDGDNVVVTLHGGTDGTFKVWVF